MKKIILPIALVCACLMIMFTIPSDAEGFDAIRTCAGSDGYKVVTTPSITVASDAAVIIGTMPYGCRTLEVYAVSANVNYGPSDISTGTAWPYIPVGTSKVISTDNNSRTPSIYFRPRGTSTGTTLLGIVAK